MPRRSDKKDAERYRALREMGVIWSDAPVTYIYKSDLDKAVDLEIKSSKKKSK